MSRLAGKHALVTGGASGIGLATARLFLQEGAEVVITDLDEPGAAASRTLDDKAHFFAHDVTSETSWDQVVAATFEALDGFDILVNCAGTGIAIKTSSRGEAHPLDQFQRIININLIGTFNCIRLATTAMIELEPMDHGERGVVINTASVAAYDGQIGQAAYSASKGGIVGMTLPVARDLADKGIRVCTIAPGIFETPLLGTLPDDVRQSLANAVPFPQKLGQPSEYAQLARQIVENVMLNAETIRLDGAIRMAPR